MDKYCHCYEYIIKNHLIFYNHILFTKIKKTIKIILQMEYTNDYYLLKQLRKKIFGKNAGFINYKLKPLLLDIFDNVHWRFRICLWGIFCPVIDFHSFMKYQIDEIIIRNGEKINIKIPQYIGTNYIDAVLANFIMYINPENLCKNYGYSSLSIIKSEGISIHQLIFHYILIYFSIFLYIILYLDGFHFVIHLYLHIKNKNGQKIKNNIIRNQL